MQGGGFNYQSYSSTSTKQTSNVPMGPTGGQNHRDSTVLINAGLTDFDGSRNVARRIMDTYDRDRNGHIDSIEVVPMIVDAYKSFNRVFSPSRADIESYLKIMDRNGDGRVTLQDL
jgi:hypothetical protein